MDEPKNSPPGSQEPSVSASGNLSKTPDATTQGGLRFDASAMSSLMQMIVKISGQEPITHDLEADTIRLGRAEDNHIRVEMPYISRHQAILTRAETRYNLRPHPEASAALIYHGRVLPAEGLDLNADD